tara:strand:- start:4183 stop:4596 length:414 start_codon:yes stop_codon:yes gene_type:complete
MYSIKDYFEQTVTFDQRSVDAFGQISGDNNPIHFDDNAAIAAGFKSKIIHGFLSGSIISKIIGTDFPGTGSIYLGQNLSFRRPMFVGVEYLVRVEILEVNVEKRRYTLSTNIFHNSSKEIVLQGDAIVMHRSSFDSK